MILLWILLSYLVIGIFFLAIFQLTTHRISQRLHDVSTDVMMKLATNGAALVTQKIAVIITLAYAWVFWPVVLIGFISDSRKPEKK
jgi:fucose permease